MNDNKDNLPIEAEVASTGELPAWLADSWQLWVESQERTHRADLDADAITEGRVFRTIWALIALVAIATFWMYMIGNRGDAFTVLSHLLAAGFGAAAHMAGSRE